ncbi:MAG: hypothetical protein JXB49_30185 [Bacteroidales bacterium]|nr:hypothetical protein [Bacteroidales bacterium]
MAWHKNLHKWLGSYIIDVFKSDNTGCLGKGSHVIFSVVDHFEPFNGCVSDEIAEERVNKWTTCLPQMTCDIRDSDGKPYIHTFFYPTEQYRSDLLDNLAGLCMKGFGEVEFHIHHDRSDSIRFMNEMEEFKNIFREKHGLLSKSKLTNEVQYGFIHGNWALDNSRPDGRYCGLNNEITLLKETGCYADFTLPSAPDITQVPKINSIYYAQDDPDRPCSHRTGIDVCVGKKPSGDLLIVQGPLTLDWSSRKKGFLPGIENGEIGGNRAPTLHRFMIWADQHISVIGRPEWIFVKIHCHGALEKNSEMLLFGEMEMFLKEIIKLSRDNDFSLHFTSSREMYNIIKAAESGETGNPNEYRNYLLER